MRIKIRTNIIDDLLGPRGRDIILVEERATLGDLLEFLTRKYGEDLANRLLKDGQLKPDLVVMIGGSLPLRSRPLDSELKDGDVVSILSIVAGG